MGFEVIPAIDVSNGRLARLHAGGLVPVEVFGGDPMAAGEAFVAVGAGWLHVVDLDLAFTGRPANLDLLGRLASLGVRVQASGGIVRRTDAEAALAAGADRVLLGSGALGEEWLPAALSGPLAEMLVMGLEVEGEVVRPRGNGRSTRPSGAWPGGRSAGCWSRRWAAWAGSADPTWPSSAPRPVRSSGPSWSPAGWPRPGTSGRSPRSVRSSREPSWAGPCTRAPSWATSRWTGQ